ncbi:DUF4365 domain-containing protein [Schlesneria sp.]|uniref:DUF4365 domain-containing protein n=1 Tax=Schlesneria sp. TaxID=2762018 RepID=UPI002F1AFB55
MILTDQQEQLSLAVLHATCARAGFGFQISGRIQDNWGWDAQADVKERFEPQSTLLNFRLRFQLKATRQELTYSHGRYSFPLDVKHYNHFRTEAGYDSPIYLVVFQMPHEEDEWLSTSPEQLVLRKCLRWVSLRDAPAPERDDQQTITVYLPEKQVLTPQALRELARIRSLEQWNNYDVEGIANANLA